MDGSIALGRAQRKRLLELYRQASRPCELRREGMVWRRPRPVPGKSDPRGAYKLRRLRELLQDLPDDEAAVFEDEVDLNLNPEIGCMWMPRGQQAAVVTPGTNVKRYMAGS